MSIENNTIKIEFENDTKKREWGSKDAVCIVCEFGWSKSGEPCKNFKKGAGKEGIGNNCPWFKWSTDLEPIYTSYDGTISNNVDELKEINIFFYQCLICHRHLLKDIADDKKDIKHILKTILESNSTYFVVGTDIEDMDSTEVFGKLDLVKIL